MIWRFIQRLRQKGRIEKLEAQVASLERDRLQIQSKIRKLEEKIETLETRLEESNGKHDRRN
jgi:hypothetical protein